MAHFTTNGKRYRDGLTLPSFSPMDLTVGSGGTEVEQRAPASLPDPDGNTLSFLYWDTGRRITNKRRVRWTFTRPANWPEWNARAWYGRPGGGGLGGPIVTVDAHWVGVAPIDPTPIDAPRSTFHNGPGGVLAHPYAGNDHLVRTEWGPATLHAKPHLQPTERDPILDFSSWIELVYGGYGTDTDYFAESDADITVPVRHVTGIAASTSTSHIITAPMGSASLLMAGYVSPPAPRVGPVDEAPWLVWLHLIGNILVGGPGLAVPVIGSPPFPIDPTDPRVLATLSPGVRDAIIGLFLGDLANTLSDPAATEQLRKLGHSIAAAAIAGRKG